LVIIAWLLIHNEHFQFFGLFLKYVVTLSQEPWYNFSQREHDIELAYKYYKPKVSSYFQLMLLQHTRYHRQKIPVKKKRFGFVDFCVATLLQYDLSQPGLYFGIILLSTCEEWWTFVTPKAGEKCWSKSPELTVNGKVTYIGS